MSLKLVSSGDFNIPSSQDPGLSTLLQPSQNLAADIQPSQNLAADILTAGDRPSLSALHALSVQEFEDGNVSSATVSRKEPLNRASGLPSRLNSTEAASELSSRSAAHISILDQKEESSVGIDTRLDSVAGHASPSIIASDTKPSLLSLQLEAHR